MAENTNKIYFCPVEVALDLIGGKWKPFLLTLIHENSLELDEICRRMPFATGENLARRLRELERDGLVERQDPAESPRYSLTLSGRRLMPALGQLRLIGRIFAGHSGIRIDDALELFQPPANPSSSEAGH